MLRWNDSSVRVAISGSLKFSNPLILEGALLFNAPEEPALRFYASNRIDALRDLPTDASHRPRTLTVMRERIEAIVGREGAFTVPKSIGYVVRCTASPKQLPID